MGGNIELMTAIDQIARRAATTAQAEAVAVRATVDLQASRLFDVRTFGAVGDGVTDDSAAFQAVADLFRQGLDSQAHRPGADAVATGSQDAAGTLFVPPGDYLVGDIVFDLPIVVQGCHRASKLIAKPGCSFVMKVGRPGPELSAAWNADGQHPGATIRDLYIAGGGRSIACNGIEFLNVDHVLLDNVTLEELAGSAIMAAGVRDSSFVNTTIRWCGRPDDVPAGGSAAVVFTTSTTGAVRGNHRNRWIGGRILDSHGPSLKIVGDAGAEESGLHLIGLACANNTATTSPLVVVASARSTQFLASEFERLDNEAPAVWLDQDAKSTSFVGCTFGAQPSVDGDYGPMFAHVDADGVDGLVRFAACTSQDAMPIWRGGAKAMIEADSQSAGGPDGPLDGNRRYGRHPNQSLVDGKSSLLGRNLTADGQEFLTWIAASYDPLTGIHTRTCEIAPSDALSPNRASVLAGAPGLEIVDATAEITEVFDGISRYVELRVIGGQILRIFGGGGIDVREDSAGITTWNDGGTFASAEEWLRLSAKNEGGTKGRVALTLHYRDPADARVRGAFIAPTADPRIPGAVWNNAGTLAISNG